MAETIPYAVSGVHFVQDFQYRVLCLEPSDQYRRAVWLAPLGKQLVALLVIARK